MSIEEHDKEGEWDRNEQMIGEPIEGEQLRVIRCKGLRKEEIEDRLRQEKNSQKNIIS